MAKKPAKNSAPQRRDESPKPAEGYHEPAERSKTLITTSQAARIAGVSPSTIVRNRTELGAIPGPNGAFLFDTQVVREKITTIRQHRTIATLGPTSGEVASAVFAALKKGKHASDIVIDLRISPEIVLALHASYEEMHGRKQNALEGARVQRTLCKCGSGRFTAFCNKCRIFFEFGTVERRVFEGTEQVRIVGEIDWGRLPEKRPGPQFDLVQVNLASEWVSADSEAGRDFVEAEHASRASADQHGDRL